MANQLPEMQPGQKIRVRYLPNGDIEYTCYKDYSGEFFPFLGLVFLILTLLFIFVPSDRKDTSKHEETRAKPAKKGNLPLTSDYSIEK